MSELALRPMDADLSGDAAPSANAAPYDVVILSADPANLVACVAAVLRAEPDLDPSHIIVVDDGARTGAEPHLPAVRWVDGAKPFIFARNANRGIAASTRDVILLNDDALLQTIGGFAALARAARSEISGPSQPLGAVASAVSGHVGNPRQRPLPGGGLRAEPRQLCFVCVYLPRETLDAVGPLDERFAGYGFEDDDYCDRIRAAGLSLAISDACIVDHSRRQASSFRTRRDFAVLTARNQRLYRDKQARPTAPVEAGGAADPAPRLMPQPDVLCALRVRNEAAHIGEVIESVLPLCRRVLLFDDHSDDATISIAAGFGDAVTVIPSPFEGLDEARDKNHLLAAITAAAPDWVLWIDGDEVLERQGPARLRPLLSAPRGPAVYSLQIAYVWDDPAQIRIDGLFGRFHRPSLFRLRGQDPRRLRFPRTGPGNLHCGNVPRGIIGASAAAPVRLKHYGYLTAEQRQRKYEWYNRVDPGNRAEDEYRHLIAIPGARHAPGPPVLVPWDG
ncbi:glycosyltransferase family 2 protein [Mangrovicella endophytica]|uniref:glycosyltransferase family 2 protein n=1 Tax=Mangrovicella endophytica TaxID=2066697 RepID=UPI000C9E2967|nr:glycosyltransferase [Mangrovicella endophytica]